VCLEESRRILFFCCPHIVDAEKIHYTELNKCVTCDGGKLLRIIHSADRISTAAIWNGSEWLTVKNGGRGVHLMVADYLTTS
jgi:hypothetical protein